MFDQPEVEHLEEVRVGAILAGQQVRRELNETMNQAVTNPVEDSLPFVTPQPESEWQKENAS